MGQDDSFYLANIATDCGCRRRKLVVGLPRGWFALFVAGNGVRTAVYGYVACRYWLENRGRGLGVTRLQRCRREVRSGFWRPGRGGSGPGIRAVEMIGGDFGLCARLRSEGQNAAETDQQYG